MQPQRRQRMRLSLIVLAAGIGILPRLGYSQQNSTGQPYKVIKSVKVGGAGGFDYVFADSDSRKLFIPRSAGADSRVTVYDLDTLAPAGVIANTNGVHGVAVDPK